MSAPTLQCNTQPGVPSIANYSIAVPTGKRIDIFNISSTGRQAELDVKYLKRGNTVVVEGDLQTLMQNRAGHQIPEFRVNAQRVTYLAPATSSKNNNSPASTRQTTSNDETQF